VQARKLTRGNQRATALSLAAKGSVVAEKCRTRCPFKRPFPHPGNGLYLGSHNCVVDGPGLIGNRGKGMHIYTKAQESAQTSITCTYCMKQLLFIPIAHK
jgi:hypothetical protein